MLQRDLLRGNSIYMVGSCRLWFLHIIQVSAVSEVGVLQEKCSWQPVPHGNFKLKLKLPPGLAAVARLLWAACRHVDAPVVFLFFYFAVRLSRRSRAAGHVPCKCSFRLFLFWEAAILPADTVLTSKPWVVIDSSDVWYCHQRNVECQWSLINTLLL